MPAVDDDNDGKQADVGNEEVDEGERRRPQSACQPRKRSWLLLGQKVVTLIPLVSLNDD